MDRLNELPFPAALADRDEDGYPVLPAQELPLCGSCGAEARELLPCIWDRDLLVGACCLVPEEPECECVTNGDLFDPRGCEVHNANSPWNVRLRAITAVQRYDEITEVA